MNKSQRIYFDTGNTTNKYINIKLEQEVETLEIMSMDLSTKDAYQDFNADYGILVGRVIANGGIGVPNAKISIFIPLLEEDENNGDIKAYYPYKTPRDKNYEGKRYNLLPRVSKINQTTGIVKPKQPFGSFPIKEEILTTPIILEVYQKYYKHTTTTNDAGDYMIFGVPIGTQTVHMSVDITDIGEYSMNPAAMVGNLGYSENLFTDNLTQIKSSTDLDDLPNIETQEVSVDIIPFWGDIENFEIGITRQDFRVRAELVNTFVVFGTAFTDSENSFWGHEIGSSRRIGELYRAGNEGYDAHETIGMYSKRIGKITEKIYYYPAEIEDNVILIADPTDPTVMRVLDKSQYSAFIREGDFVFIINCNRDKVITNEYGEKVSVADDSINGIFTKFKGFITLELTSDELPMDATDNIGNNTTIKQYRFKFKFPQYSDSGDFFEEENDNDSITNTMAWRKQHYTFEAQKFYSFARFHPLTSNNNDWSDNSQFPTKLGGFFDKTRINNRITKNGSDPFWNIGIIMTESYGRTIQGDDETITVQYPNEDYEFPSNTHMFSNDKKAFGANWVNFAVYFPQLGYVSRGYDYIKGVRTTDMFHKQKEKKATTYNKYYLSNNSQEIAAGDFNTKYFARNDLNWTDIIEVPISDIQFMNDNVNQRGYTATANEANQYLEGTYRNGSNNSTLFGWLVTSPCPYDGGKDDADLSIPNNTQDTNFYFYKGYKGADCFQYLEELGLI